MTAVIEDEGETLLRQVHPSMWSGNGLAKSAFLPSELDQDRLSTLREAVGAETAFKRWVDSGHESSGTYGINVGLAISQKLECIDDADDETPDHASVDFAQLPTRGSKQQVARKLRDAAVEVGCLHPAN